MVRDAGSSRASADQNNSDDASILRDPLVAMHAASRDVKTPKELKRFYNDYKAQLPDLLWPTGINNVTKSFEVTQMVSAIRGAAFELLVDKHMSMAGEVNELKEQLAAQTAITQAGASELKHLRTLLDLDPEGTIQATRVLDDSLATLQQVVGALQDQVEAHTEALEKL